MPVLVSQAMMRPWLVVYFSFTRTTVSSFAVSSLPPSAEKLKAAIGLVVGYRAGNVFPVATSQRQRAPLARWLTAATTSEPSGEIASAFVRHPRAGWGHCLTRVSVAR